MRKILDAGKWLELAKSTDDARTDLFLQHGKTTADGFRLHTAPDAQAVVCECQLCKGSGLASIRDIPLPDDRLFFVETQALIDVAKAARGALGKKQYSCALTITVGETLTVTWGTEHPHFTVYTVEVKAGYVNQFADRETAFASFSVDPDYLYEALLGMRTDLSVIGQKTWREPLIIVEDPVASNMGRKAIVMPMLTNEIIYAHRKWEETRAKAEALPAPVDVLEYDQAVKEAAV